MLKVEERFCKKSLHSLSLTHYMWPLIISQYLSPKIMLILVTMISINTVDLHIENKTQVSRTHSLCHSNILQDLLTHRPRVQGQRNNSLGLNIHTGLEFILSSFQNYQKWSGNFFPTPQREFHFRHLDCSRESGNQNVPTPYS